MFGRSSLLLAIFGISLSMADAMAIEEAEYRVLEREGQFEIREYAEHIVAETIAGKNFEEAGSVAFKRLFRYISGDNESRRKIAMAAPVSQRTAGEKIAMTAPVSQRPSDSDWAVSFMMPSSYTIDTLPVPSNPEIKIRTVRAHIAGAVQYSGFWSEKNYLENKSRLEAWIEKKKFIKDGNAVWARYNAPFTPWFLRRNEILIPLAMQGQVKGEKLTWSHPVEPL